MTSSFPRPGLLTKPENIPLDLRNDFQWTVYKLKLVDAKLNKYKKPPVHWRTGFRDLYKDEAMDLGTFDEVVNAIRSGAAEGHYGIGIVLTKEARAVCFDVDSADGFEFVDTLNEECRTYAETSISGKGRHYIWRGDLPHGRGAIVNKAEGIEVYAHDRFIAITGNTLPQGNGHLADASAFLARIFAGLPAPRPDVEAGVTSNDGQTQGLPDVRVVAILRDYYERTNQSYLWEHICSHDELTRKRSEVCFRVASDLDRIVGDPEQVWRIMNKMPMLAQNGYNREKFERAKVFDSWIRDGRAGTTQGIPNITIHDYGNGPSIEHGRAMAAGMVDPTTGRLPQIDRTPEKQALDAVRKAFADYMSMNINTNVHSMEKTAALIRDAIFVGLPGPEIDDLIRWCVAGNLGNKSQLKEYRKEAEIALLNERRFLALRDGDWQGKLQQNLTGTAYMSNIHNIDLMLMNHDNFAGRFAFDEFTERTMCMQRPSWVQSDGGVWVPTPMQDEGLTHLTAALQGAGLKAANHSEVARCLDAVARKNGFNSLQDYLGSLVWDGTPRIDHWLHRYCQTSDTVYEQKAGAWWLISAVARAYVPGVKVDHVLLLEGLQGVKKSTTWMIVARRQEWYLEYTEDLKTAEGRKQLRGRWIIALPELSALSKKEARDVKAFVTRQSENYRDIFEKYYRDHARSSVLCGDTNDEQYFTDRTGNRRYWPVATGVVQANDLDADMDQLWAEAVVRYRAGDRWWPDDVADAEFIRLQAAQTEKRRKDDVWHQHIVDWLDRETAAGREVDALPNATNLAFKIIGIQVKDVKQADAEQIGGVLKLLGYERQSVWLDGKTQQGFKKKD